MFEMMKLAFRLANPWSAPRRRRTMMNSGAYAHCVSAEMLEIRCLLTDPVAPLIDLDTRTGNWGEGLGSSIGEITVAGNQAFFIANDGIHGTELWRTDGTASGTRLVRDIWPGSGTSRPHSLIRLGDKVAFVAESGSYNFQLWISDGTENGTSSLTLPFVGTEYFNANPQNLTVIDNWLYFTAGHNAPAGGHRAMYRTNGTTPGTVLVTPEWQQGEPALVPTGPPVKFQSKLFFPMNSAYREVELWTSDGTPAGTQMFANINAVSSSEVRDLIVSGNRLYFTAEGVNPDGTRTGRELWVSDGTVSGTMMLADIMAGAGESSIGELTDVNGVLYFSAAVDTGNRSASQTLWKSEGTPATTVQMAPASTLRSPVNLLASQGRLFFNAYDGQSAEELWIADALGVRRIKDILPGTSRDGSNPRGFVELGGLIYFAAISSVGRELWQTDGTTDGTQLVLDITRDNQSSNPVFLTTFNESLLFSAKTNKYGDELYLYQPPRTPNNDDLTEGNLVGWSTFAADNAVATVVLDTTRVQVGTQSLLFETQSGFDTGVRLTAPAGGWDLRNRRQVEYWCYGDNNTTFGWQGNQPIIVLKSPTGSLTLTPTGQLMPNQAWTRIVAPFAGNENFQVSTEGFFDLSNVTELEIHQDTWDYGFRAYYDGLKFAGSSSGITNDQSSFLGIPSVQTSQRPVISWTPITTAVRYDLWVNNLTTGQGQFIREQNLSSISYVSSFDLPLASYSAWVRGIDSAGVASRWSNVANFRIAPPVILQAMAKQQNTSRPIVQWTPLSGAVKYDVWLNNLSTGQSQFVRNSNVSGTSWIHTTDLPIGKYRVWVRGIDTAGGTSAWSAAVDFDTVPAPSLTAPGVSTFNRRPTFVWNHVAGAVQYDVFVKNLNTGATTFYPKGITTTNWTPPTSLPDGPYRWWVQARSAQNISSLWSAPADVYIGGRTNITSPIGVQATRRPVFTWQAVDGAESYEIWVNNYQNTQRVIYQVDLRTATFTPATSLATGTYRVWVRAISTAGSASPWSTEAVFTV